jgi:hypothetical protein
MDGFEPGAEELVDESHEHCGIGLRPGRAEEDFVPLGILDGLDHRACRDHAHAGLAHDAADPGQPDGVEARLRFVAIEQRRRRHAAVDQGEHAAVARRDIVEKVGGADAAAADHVLHHNGRAARQVLAHVARQHAGVLVVAAARGPAGDQRDLTPAEIELIGRLGAGIVEPQRCGQAQAYEELTRSRHACGSRRVNRNFP